MQKILENWNRYIGKKDLIKEVEWLNFDERDVHNHFPEPDSFINQFLPKVIEKETINNLTFDSTDFDILKNITRSYGIFDFAFEAYRDLFPSVKDISPTTDKFIVKDNTGKPFYFDYSQRDVLITSEIPNGVPTLPEKWYWAYLVRERQKKNPNANRPEQNTVTEKKKKKERNLELVKTLAVFDFDETLFKSDEAARRQPTDHPLSPDSLPDNPEERDWNLDIVYKAQELCSNPAVYCVMMTGRVGKNFREKIDKILLNKNLFFAETHYNDFGGDTVEYKEEAIRNILAKLPNVKKLIMWEDQADKAEQYTEDFESTIDFHIHLVGKENS